MAGAVATADRISTLKAKLAAVATETGDTDFGWLAERLELFLTGATFEAACDLGPWWRSDVAGRDGVASLVRIARRFPGLSGRGQARRIEAEICCYVTGSWPGDRRAGRRPAGLIGDIFDLLQARGGRPLGAARIRTLLQLRNGFL